jgi:hypothetical protein
VVIPAHHIRFYVAAMSNAPASTDGSSGASPYEICLQGHLDTRWAAWFDGLTLRHENDGTTVITGPIADQAALHGLLQKVRDLGLQLVSVNSVTRHHTDTPSDSQRSTS